MNQLAIDFARQEGERAATACLQKAERIDPEFRDKARKAILDHLKVVKRCSGEDLTDIAIAKGARSLDGRAFGGIYIGLQNDKLIRCIRSDLPRRRGHGTSGGKLWEIVE